MIASLDIGTSVAKCVVFSPDGTEFCVTEHGFPLHTDPSGSAFLAAEDIRNAIHAVVASAMGKLESLDTPKGKALDALVLSTQGGSTIVCDEDGQCIGDVVTWMDSRPSKLVEQWNVDGTADLVRSVSGWKPQPGLPLAQLAWLRMQGQQVSNGKQRVVSLHDWVVHELTGNWTTCPSSAGEMLLVSLESGTWDPMLCSRFGGVGLEQLSDIRPSHEIVGTIVASVSNRTGLPKDLVVVNGGQDHSCELYALDLEQPGTLVLACGTAWVLNMVASAKRIREIPSNLDINSHVVSGSYTASTFLGGFGATLRWCAQLLWGGPESMALLDASAADIVPGSNGLHFSPMGRHSGGLEGLELHHGKGDIARALMEGVALEVHAALGQLADSGFPTSTIWMIGGAARSTVWPSIVSSVCACPVMLSQYSHGPALGAAMIAAETLGMVGSHAQALQLFGVRGVEVVVPQGWNEAYKHVSIGKATAAD